MKKDKTKSIDNDIEQMENIEEATINGLKKAEEVAVEKIDEDFLASIKAQEIEMQNHFKDFNLKDEIEKNPLFAVMLSYNESVLDAYFYFNPEIYQKEVEKRVIDRIKNRNAKPSYINAKSANSKVDINNLSEKDIEEIDKRVRRGERIEL